MSRGGDVPSPGLGDEALSLAAPTIFFSLRFRSLANRFQSVSLAEVKASIAGMTVEERLEVAALIAHLNRAEDPAYQAELDQRMSAMDSGRKTDAPTLKKIHEGSAAHGR